MEKWVDMNIRGYDTRGDVASYVTRRRQERRDRRNFVLNREVTSGIFV